MRIVADTNIIVSAFLWGGTPRRLLDAGEAQHLDLFTSRALVAELEDVLLREKFAAQLRRTRFTPAYLLARYTQLATLIAPAEITVQELRDPDDAAVLACALAAKPMRSSQAIPICTRSAATRASRFSRPLTASGASPPKSTTPSTKAGRRHWA